MAKSRKQKQQRRIARIIADGRVTKKEAKKAAKQGISLARIQKAQIRSYKPGNVFSRPETSPPSRKPSTYAPGSPRPSKPAYTPLLIKGKAQKVFDKPKTTPASTKTTTTTTGTTGKGTGKGTNYSKEINTLLGRIGDLETQLSQQPEPPKPPDYEAIFAQQAEEAAAQRQADLAAMQQQQALYMEEVAARQAEQERQRLLTAQTQQANIARSSLTPDFSIGGRARTDLYGTGGFKRRRRIRPATIAQGIAPIAAVAAGATNGNLLNV